MVQNKADDQQVREEMREKIKSWFSEFYTTNVDGEKVGVSSSDCTFFSCLYDPWLQENNRNKASFENNIVHWI